MESQTTGNRWSPLAKGEGTEIRVDKYCKRAFLLLALLVAVCEFTSIQLFLWPVDHYCARPTNLTGHSEFNFVAGPNNKTIDLTGLKINPFDATPADEFTRARAASMGIGYDDISGCFEYPTETNTTTGNSLVNMESLESCRYGLHFEIQDHSLSLIDDFNLACSRQWLKVLLPQALGLGLILGLVSVNWTPNVISRLSRSHTKFNESFLNLLLVQILVGGLLIFYTKHLLTAFKGTMTTIKHGHESDYIFMVSCVLLRALLQSTNVCRVIKVWVLDTDNNSKRRGQNEQLRENHVYFMGFWLLYILAQMLLQPILLRTFDHWTTLNEFLSISTVMCVILMNLVELVWSLTQDQYETVDLEPNRLSILDGSEAQLASDSQEGCEFCQVRGLDYNRVIPNEEKTGAAGPNLVDAYEPTTITQTSLALREGQPPHRGNFKRSVVVKVLILTISLSLNFLLLKMLPDNDLMHQEAVRFKVNHNRTIKHHSKNSTTTTNLEESNKFLYTLEHNSTITLLSDTNQSLVEEYRSFGYARRSAEWMDEAENPLKIFWTTITLNGWPIEILALLLHSDAILSFESAHFKLSRLFSFVQFGAKLQAVEWILLALMHGKHHLLEAHWLYTIIYSVARLCSTLMLYHHIHTILKLSRKLASSQLLSYTSSFICVSAALILASLAPILIKVDLVVVPLIFVINNTVADWLAKNLRHRFAESICPMIFEENSHRNDKKELVS